MRRRSFYTIAGILFFQLSQSQELLFHRDSLPGLHFSMEKFEKNLSASLQDSSIGWAYGIWKDGNIVSEKAGGYKIKPSDTKNGKGALFSADTRMHIASLSKSITALAIVKLIEMNKLNWDDRVALFLPSHWKLHSLFVNVTIRQLVNMTSGLDGPLDAFSSGYDSLQQIIQRSPNPDKIGKFNYQNTAYGLLRIIIAYASGFAEYSDNVQGIVSASAISRHYTKFINNHILQPAGIPHAECYETSTEPVMRYSFPPDTIPGELSGSGDGNLALYAGGFGWYLSATDIGKLLTAVFFKKSIISQNVLNELISMEFPFRIRRSKYGSYFGTGGDWGYPLKPKGWAGIHTYFMCFPGNVYAVVFTNSGEGSPSSKILRSYRNAFIQ